MFRPFVLDDTGRPFVEFVAPDADAGIIAGQAYVGNGTADAVYLTTDAVAASDGIVGGFRYTTAGALRAYDATAGLPAGTSTNQGIAMTSDGQVCYSTAASGTYFNIAGVAVDSSGRVLIDPLTFELLFADLGAGVVSTVDSIGAATPTFTRATVAWTKLASGLWAEVASGSPRSFYSGFTTAVGSYLGYLAEGARTQLVTPDAAIRDMTDAAWVAGATLTVAKTGTGIDGVANSCSRLTGGAVAATNTILQALVAAASSRTYSVWLRRVTGTGMVNITQDGGATWTAVTSSLTSDNFVRVSLTASVLNAAFGVQVETDGDVILADFNQFEAGAFASTPIPTTAARNADVLTYPTTGWLNASAGTFFSQWQALSAAANQRIALCQPSGDSNNRLFDLFLNANPQSAWFGNAASAQQFNIGAGATVTSGTTFKTAGVYASNSAQLCANGTLGTEDTSVTLPTGTFVLTLGIFDGGSNPLFGPIRRVAYYAARLPNATLQELTA